MDKKGQVTIIGLFRVGILIVCGFFIIPIFLVLKDWVLQFTENLWVIIPILAIPLFFGFGIIFELVNTLRTGQ
jgi:hypothetical protein